MTGRRLGQNPIVPDVTCTYYKYVHGEGLPVDCGRF